MKNGVVVLFLLTSLFASAQNLVPNPDFHDLESCPQMLAEFVAAEWIDPIFPAGSSDCFNICSSTFATSVPTNGFGFQESETGEGYIGLTAISNQDEYREYVQVELIEPLQEGLCYEITMTFSRSDVSGSSNNLGLAITNNPPVDFFAVEPQLEITDVIVETVDWEEEVIQVVADGGERFLSIGNFRTNVNTTFVPNPPVPYAYYLIDFVSVELIDLQYSEELVDLGDDVVVCQDEFPFTITSNQPAAINSWSTGESATSIEVLNPGKYYLTVTENCEFGIDSIEVFIDDFDLDVDLGMDTMICAGTSLELNLADLALFELEWQDGSILATQTLDEPQIYWLNVTNACGVEIRDSIEIDFLPSIAPFTLGPVEGLCNGDTVILEGFQDNVVSYSWQDNSTESSFSVTESGIYSLEIEGLCESFASDIIIENQEQVEIEVNIDSSYLICDGEELTINVESTGGEEIVWQDGFLEFQRVLDRSGSYSFQLFNFCKDSTFTFELEVENCFAKDVYIPNVFTPNNDGVNDVFGIFLPEEWVEPKVEISIYNRWGERMFFSEEIDFKWDGRFKNRDLNPGIYIYRIIIEVEVGSKVREVVFNGDVTIMK